MRAGRACWGETETKKGGKMKYLIIIIMLPVLAVAQNNLRFAKFEKNPDGEVGTLLLTSVAHC